MNIARITPVGGDAVQPIRELSPPPVNREFADPQTPVRNGDECAFTPVYKR